MKTIGCAVDSIKLAICLAALAILIGVPVIGFWRAEGALSALGVLALLVGIGWNSRPFKKRF